MKTYAIIPSGGEGKRISGSLPKQYRQFDGKEMIAYTLETFQKCDEVDEIVIAARDDYFELISKLKEKYKITKLSRVVSGGKERQDSVYNAFNSIKWGIGDLIAVHDAARPLLPNDILTSAIISAKKYDNIVVAYKAKDTLVKADDFIESYLSRDEIYFVQTPQIFRAEILKEAFEKAIADNFYGTDESMLVKRASYDVRIVEGSAFNFKVTTDSDLELFQKLIAK
ncbi:MAG: 2-C-methyl-D-erythritol 4-phosphate cytidylyltransferase [bacterium]